MKVALLCDVDQTTYHVGDEAICEASAAALRDRGAEVVRISRGEAFGPDGQRDPDAPISLRFPWPLELRDAYLQEIRALVDGDTGVLPPHDRAHALMAALADVDAVVLGGGGNLNSRYGWLLDERLATALMAHRHGKPVVLTGQSLGPELSPHDRESLAELLRLCTLVGVRDEASARLARDLVPDHPAIVHTTDDAVGLLPQAPSVDEKLISVTLGADPEPLPRESYLAVLAAVVDTLAERTGARVDLVPHMADPQDGGADEQVHTDLAALLRTPVTAHRIESATASAARTAGAGWVVSTRFHPVVFGAMAGAAVLALPLNRYGRQRMDGALSNMGLEQATVPVAALWDSQTDIPRAELVDQVVEALIAHRVKTAAHLGGARERVLAAYGAWWDRIVAVLAGDAGAREGLVDPVADDRPLLAPWPELAAPLAPFTGTGEPTAAIVMRTRNRPEMLDRAIQDVLSQTRTDWELLVVNDVGERGPADEVIDRHRAEAGERLRVMHRESSTGMESASNAGIAATSAPLIAIHDDDDTWHPTFLQETIAALDAHPERDLVSVRTIGVHERRVRTGYVDDESWQSWYEVGDALLLDHLTVNRTVPISVLHRRALHEKIGLFDESLPVVGDFDFMLRALQESQVLFLERPLAYWRQRPQAEGEQSNSIFARAQEHRHFDARLRDRHLREWTDENGLGLPLFIAHVARTEAQEASGTLRAQLDRIEAKLDVLLAQQDTAAPVEPGGSALRRAVPEPVKEQARRARRVAGRLHDRLR